MNGLEALKPILTALVLPPVPWLVMILVAARVLPRRPRLGHFFIGLGVALIWLGSCQAVGRWLHLELGLSPPPLSAPDVAALKARADGSTAIVVLGGGLVADATRPGTNDLSRISLERLRYGIRLARSTGLPLGFSGGLGWSQRTGTSDSEAEAARRSAEQDFMHGLKWIEPGSRDTRENARQTVALLQPQGVRHLVLVTHAFHMPRAVTMFEQAAGASMRITAAPMGHLSANDGVLLDWLPTMEGFEQVRLALREWLGRQVARWSTASMPASVAQSETPPSHCGEEGSGGMTTMEIRAV